MNLLLPIIAIVMGLVALFGIVVENVELGPVRIGFLFLLIALCFYIEWTDRK